MNSKKEHVAMGAIGTGEFPELKRPTIILLTSLDTGWARYMCLLISRWAVCPYLKHEVILDSFSNGAGYQRGDTKLPGEEEATQLQSVSFDATCSTAIFQLKSSAPTKCVVISTSLIFHKSTLLQLLGILQDNFSTSRLLIVECKLKSKFLWQQDFELETVLNKRKCWFEEKSWKDVEKTVLKQQKEGIDEYLCGLFPSSATATPVDAINLVIDPPFDITSRDVDDSFDDRLRKGSVLMDALKDLLTCYNLNNYGDRSHVVNYGVWRRQRLEQLGHSFASRVITQRCNSPGDCIFRYTHNPSPNDEEPNCDICDGKIPNAQLAYFCQFCSLSFHHSCCQTINTANSMEMCYNFIFPETHACHSCTQDRKQFSKECKNCVFQTLLKTRLVAPVGRHQSDNHHIFSIGVSVSWRNYMCNACKLQIGRIKYGCIICSLEYHLECFNLPLKIEEHHHGGHLHTVEMKYLCDKDEEYEWCNVCYKDIDPDSWVYTCQDCDYIAHLYCLFPILSHRYAAPFT